MATPVPMPTWNNLYELKQSRYVRSTTALMDPNITCISWSFTTWDMIDQMQLSQAITADHWGLQFTSSFDIDFCCGF